ncbi:sugar efflux transporter [Paenibacillus sp. NRS-1782]|uniref:sugar efflux transporter n=1 Tax=unclassified Paenibacillus TaxID=185978 RepID=UPI003D2740B2
MIMRIKNLFVIHNYPLFMICMLLQGMAISISAPFLAVYFTTTLGVSVGTFGVFTAVTLICGIWISSLIAKRSDRGLDRKQILVICMLFNAVAFAGYLVIQNFYVLIVYMTIFTAVGAPGMPQLFASAREAVNRSKSADHAFANSTLRSMFSLGFITGPLFGSFLIAHTGFKGIFVGTTSIFVFIAVLLFCFIKQPPVQLKNKDQTSHQHITLHKNIEILIPFSVLTLLYVAHWMNSLNISLFIIHNLKGDTNDVALVSSICAVIEIPLMIMLGVLAAKYSNRLLIFWGALTGIVYYLLVLMSTEIWQLLVGQLLLAFFVAVISAIGISYMQDLLPSLPGYASTLYSNATTIGRLAGSLMGGLTAQWMGYRNSYWVCLALILCSLGLLAISKKLEFEKSAALQERNQSL